MSAPRCARVPAASINPLDWHYLEGVPYVVRLLDSGVGTPDNPRLGVDFAGTVEAVGKNVTQFKPGDEVFGGKNGALAEYVCVLADRAGKLDRIVAGAGSRGRRDLPIAGARCRL